TQTSTTHNSNLSLHDALPIYANLSHLTLGAVGDADIVEVTGLSEGQIKQSLCKAASAFNWDVKQHVINIVVMEADNYHDINIREDRKSTRLNSSHVSISYAVF